MITRQRGMDGGALNAGTMPLADLRAPGFRVDRQLDGNPSLRPRIAARVASSGMGESNVSQPRSCAVSRNWANFLRPMVLARAMALAVC